MKKIIKNCMVLLGMGIIFLGCTTCNDPAEGSIRYGVPVFGTYSIVNVGSDYFELQWPVLADETGQRAIITTDASMYKPIAIWGDQPPLFVAVSDLVAQWDHYLALGYIPTQLSTGDQSIQVSGIYEGSQGLDIHEFSPTGPVGSIENRRVGNLQPATWYCVKFDTRLVYDHWGYVAEPVAFLVKTLP